jgi:high-affinity iron transporter
MAAQAILFLQQGGYFEFLTGTVWNTSWLLKQDSIVGRLLHTLVGYNDSPNGAQLVVYAATVISIMLLTRIERTRHPRRVTAPGAA